MMQNGHALDSTLNIELVVTLRCLNLGLVLGLRLELDKCWIRYKSAFTVQDCVESPIV